MLETRLNPTTDEWERPPQEIQRYPEQRIRMHEAGPLGFLDPDLAERDPLHSCFPAGQGCRAIHAVQTSQQIIDDIVAGAETILGRGIVPTRAK